MGKPGVAFGLRCRDRKVQEGLFSPLSSLVSLCVMKGLHFLLLQVGFFNLDVDIATAAPSSHLMLHRLRSLPLPLFKFEKPRRITLIGPV